MADPLTEALAGGALVIATGTAGAIVGYLSAPPSSQGFQAVVGAGMGIVVGGVLGIGVAAFVPEWRAAGYWAMGIVGGLAIIGLAKQAVLPAADQPVPTA